MPYARPRMSERLEPAAKTRLLKSYFDFCERAFVENPENLNQKLPRETFSSLLDEVGSLLIARSGEMAEDVTVKSYLDSTPLPPEMDDLLPNEFRVFCLALNALKQWVSAEQSATDRFLLGGTGRQRCKNVSTHCLVTGEPLNPETL